MEVKILLLIQKLENGITDKLPRTVKSDLSTTSRLDDGVAVLSESLRRSFQEPAAAGSTQRDHVRVAQ